MPHESAFAFKQDPWVGGIKRKSFCTAKETISKMKRQPSEWEKIIANETRTKDYFPKYTNSSFNSIPEKQPNQKVGKRPKQTFLQKKTCRWLTNT